MNYSTVEHWIIHCFSIFTYEKIAVTVEKNNDFFSVGRVTQLLQKMSPSNSCSWTHSSFARKFLKTENFNQIITMLKNLFTKDLDEILSLKTNCITLGKVSKHNSFTGLKFANRHRYLRTSIVWFDIGYYALESNF